MDQNRPVELDRKSAHPREGNRPLASISLDLDNLWAYLKTRGDPRWEQHPSYLDQFLPSMLHLLHELDLKITFFVVGQDAVLERNHAALRLISQRGHEVGNHSLHHDPRLHLYSKARMRDEILEADEVIRLATGQKPIGFRGPNFTRSAQCMEILAENGYLYDSSSLPTFLGPLARAYYFAKANVAGDRKRVQRELFGSFRNGMDPVQPYYCAYSVNHRLLEIPVTTIPFLKMPFHLSYLMYIGGFSEFLMHVYLHMAIRLCLLRGVGINFLMHPLDFLGADSVPELGFLPAMHLSTDRKVKLAKGVLKHIMRYFTFLTMNQYAERMVRENCLG